MEREAGEAMGGELSGC